MKEGIIVTLALLVAILLLICVHINGRVGDLDCRDFENQEEAQKEFKSHRTDIHQLDGNGDGTACNNYNY